MATESLPPPTYSQEAELSDASSTSDADLHPQILITPSSDSINFQKGYLGAEGERAAIEGEIQIKGAELRRWARLTVSLRVIETAFQREIELGFSEVELFSASATSSSSGAAADAVLPSTFLFAIPLMEDTPQSLRTPHSSISHTLTASLFPQDSSSLPVTKSLIVHTRRYTAHSHSVVVSPETHALDEPTRVEVQVPRTTFVAGEIIPLYVTVPPPPRELVVDQGLRLRNVRVELLRIVEVKKNEENAYSYEDFTSSNGESSSGPSTATAYPVDKPPLPSTSKAAASLLFPGPNSTIKTVIARSGASCRFHSSRPVQLRFVLHQPSPSASPSDFQINLPTSDYGHFESDAECSSITQLTLLHSVTFQLNVYASFVDMSTRTERISTISIPVVLLAPPAPLPQIAPSMDAAYSKKHDRPPARTVRQEEGDFAPHYSEGEAGPSGLGGAPPPFEERDAPPPFFSSATEASSSSRLPTFLESEREIIIPPDGHHSGLQHPDVPPLIVGEGVDFGFSAADQFDGHTEDIQRSSTPPPTLEMADRDANLTPLTVMHEPERAIEALGLVLDQHEEDSRGGEVELPPPPPALDDPSDPPPSIYSSDFRSPNTPHPPSPPLAAYVAPESTRMTPLSSAPDGSDPASHGNHAPPPYIVPEQQHTHQRDEHVARPPPYVD
ncbi:ARID domain-containing protein [Favolaschia claudopus]|uniref:ARID domain-containing protein n=1 Tax=Favolaschia claudopus TaxID=2862362 RepID=A0AAW0EJI3_9AGAR